MITVKRAGQQGVIIRTYKYPKLQLHKLVHFTKCLYNIDCIKKMGKITIQTTFKKICKINILNHGTSKSDQ